MPLELSADPPCNASMSAFKFELQQRVRVCETGQVVEICQRYWNETTERGRLVHAYAVRFRKSNGHMGKAWFRESALKTLRD